jgi:single-strand DNA-binding protein
MKNLVNRVQLIGRLGMDAEIRTFDKDKQMARVSIATNTSYKDADGKKVEQTDWHTLVAWGKNAELAEKFFKKGKEIAIDGKLVSRTYEDKEGKKQYTTEVHINDFLLLGKKEN